MGMTEDYLEQIRARRQAREPVELDFGVIPAAVDRAALAQELAGDLPEGYGQEITKRIRSNGKLTLDYGEALGPDPVRTAGAATAAAIKAPLGAFKTLTSLSQPDNAERAAKDIAAGVAGTVEGVGGYTKALGAEELGEQISAPARRFRKEMSPADPTFLDEVAQGLGSSAVFLIPGFGVARGATALAGVAPRIAAVMGVTVPAVLEAMVEGGGVYEDLVAKGKTPEEAAKAAHKTFALNVPAIAATEFLGVLSPTLRGSKRAIASTALEGFQEGLQEGISNFAQGKKGAELLEGTGRAAAIGAIVGNVSGLAVNTADGVLERYQNRQVEATLEQLGTRPAITPEETAARAATSAPELGNLTAILTGQADAPALMQPAVARADVEIRRFFNLPPEVLLTPQVVSQAIEQDVLPAPEAMRLERQIFEESYRERQDLDPRGLEQARQAAAEAARAPAAVLRPKAEEALMAATDEFNSEAEAIVSREEAARAAEASDTVDTADTPQAAPEATQAQPEPPPAPLEVVLPGAEKPIGQQSAAEFIETLQADPEAEGVPVTELLQAHQDIVQPEGDVSFRPEELETIEPAGRPGAAPLANLTPEEFAQRFPGAPAELHKAAVRSSLAAGQDVPQAIIDKYPEILEEVERDAQEAAAAGAQEGEEFPVLKFARRFGLNIDEVKKAGYGGELEEAKGRGIMRRRGGMSVGKLVELAAEEKVLPEADERIFFDRLTAELRKSSEVFQLREGDQEFKATEEEAAFGKVDIRKLRREVAGQIAEAGQEGQLELQLGSGIPQSVQTFGVVNYVGTSISNVKQLAEVVAALRHPKLEHFQALYLKDGKIIGHQVYTSHLPFGVNLPPQVWMQMEEDLERLNPDEMYFAHNHPSGDPTPSEPDVKVTARAYRRFGPRFKGHLITNGKKFSVLGGVPGALNVRFEKFLEPKPDFNEGLKEITGATAAAGVAAGHWDGSGTVVLSMGSGNLLLGVDVIPDGSRLEEALVARGRHHGAAKMIIAHGKGKTKKGAGLPKEVVDVIELDEEGGYSYRSAGKLRDLIGDTSIWQKERSREYVDRVMEEPAPYGVDPGQLKARLEAKKLQPGSEVTLRRGIQDPGAGAIPRGTKGKLVSVNLETGDFLVTFGDELSPIPAMLSSQQLEETYQAPPKPTPAAAAKQQIARSTGLAPGSKVGLTEQQLLQLKLSAEARGSRLGARAAAKQARADILRTFQARLEAAKEKADEQLVEAEGQARWREAEIADVKAKVAEFAEKNLPLAARGRWLTAVRDAKTPKDVAKAFARVDMEVKLLHRKGLIADLKKVVRRALESGRVAVEIKAKIEQVIAGFELQGHTAAKLEQLRNVQAFVDAQKAKGIDVELPGELLGQLEILSRRPLKEISNADLERMLAKIQDLEDLGRKFVFNRENYRQLVKDRLKRELIAGVVPIEKHPKVQAKTGERLGLKGRINNAVAYTRDFFTNLDLGILSMDAFFDMIDGGEGFQGANYQTFKQTLDDRFADYLRMADRWKDQIRTLAAELKLDDLNFERIGIYAIRRQRGGLAHLVANGHAVTAVKDLQLTPAELQMYEKMRAVIEEPFPQVQRLMAELYNRSVRKVQNYFPFQTDWKRISDFEVVERLGSSLEGLGRRTKTLEQGMTKSRVGGRQPVKLHAFDIFEKHMDDVAYLLALQKDVKMLTEVAKSPEYRTAAGEVGSAIVIDWLDVMARKGGAGRVAVSSVLGVSMDDALGLLRRNVGAAAMGLKVTSIIIQPTALLDGCAIVGGPQVMQGLERILTDKKWRQFLLDNLPELKARVGDDPAFMDLSLNRELARFQSWSLGALQQMDRLTAAAVAAGAYQKSLDEQGKLLSLEVPDPAALREAARLMRISQGSPFFKDVSLAISRGRLTGIRALDKAFLQFKSFMTNRWTNERYTVPAMWRQGDQADAALAYGYYALANVAEAGVRLGWRAAVIAAVGGVMPDWDDFEEDLGRQVLQNVPFVSDYLNWSKYHQFPMPALDPALDLAEGSYRAAVAKDGQQKVRAVVRTIEAAARLGGLPGTGQVAELVRAAIKGGRQVFPWQDDLRDLRGKAKADTLTEGEQVRLELLKAARSDFDALNKDYKAALELGDTDKAREIGEEILEAMEDYRDLLEGDE